VNQKELILGFRDWTPGSSKIQGLANGPPPPPPLSPQVMLCFSLKERTAWRQMGVGFTAPVTTHRPCKDFFNVKQLHTSLTDPVPTPPQIQT
jgi:hypothetical protein